MKPFAESEIIVKVNIYTSISQHNEKKVPNIGKLFVLFSFECSNRCMDV